MLLEWSHIILQGSYEQDVVRIQDDLNAMSRRIPRLRALLGKEGLVRLQIEQMEAGNIAPTPDPISQGM